MKTFTAIAIFMVLLCSCKSKTVVVTKFDIFEDFDVTTDLTDYEIVTSDLLTPSRIVVLDSLVFASEWQSDPMIVCYDMETQTINRFLRKGRGPGEVSNLLRLYAGGDSTIQATVDPGGLFIYNKADIRNAVMPDEIISLKEGYSAFNSIVKAGPGSVIFMGKDPENTKSPKTRFCIYDLKTDRVHCFGEYPSRDENVKNIPAEDFSRQTAYQGDVVVRPDGSRAVAFYLYAVGFDIIDIKERTVVQSKFYQYPTVSSEYIPEIQANVIRRVPESYRGFINAFCSNDYIYFLYTDKTFGEADSTTGRHILKYDWDGNPVCHYVLDEEVNSFTMDKSEENLYATRIDENSGYLIRYKI
jgi:hypothetical protein